MIIVLIYDFTKKNDKLLINYFFLPFSSDMDDDEPIEAVESSESEHEYNDPKLDKTESELKKISNGMASVFLDDLAVERQKRKAAMSTKHIDPRSAARTPAANKEPYFRLR